MPDWGNVLKEIARTLAETHAQGQARRTTGKVPYQVRLNRCLFWSCKQAINPDHVFCYDHWLDFQHGLIDECPTCSRAKDRQYNQCLDCANAPTSRQVRPSGSSRWYKREYSPSWQSGDAETAHFYVYVLKLNGGMFYAGQTRELRERLSEHRDGRVQSTIGQSPKLVWFTTVSSREEATSLESQLKRLVDTNPREIRRMVLSFSDLVKELDYS